ncbi:MAG: XkdX family protein [Enterocloster asparagiformis]|nr:XkdX family protein [Enterocloster asparagiformis]
MDVKALAEKYYPRLWDINRLRTLVAAGKLSETDYQEITGEIYTV